MNSEEGCEYCYGVGSDAWRFGKEMGIDRIKTKRRQKKWR